MITPKRYLRRSAFVDAIEIPKKDSDNFNLQDAIPELARLSNPNAVFIYVGSGEHHQTRMSEEYDDFGYLKPDADPYILVRYAYGSTIRINPGDFVVGVDGYLTVMAKSEFEVDFCKTELPVCEDEFGDHENHEENPEEDNHEEENTDVDPEPLEEESPEYDN